MKCTMTSMAQYMPTARSGASLLVVLMLFSRLCVRESDWAAWETQYGQSRDLLALCFHLHEGQGALLEEGLCFLQVELRRCSFIHVVEGHLGDCSPSPVHTSQGVLEGILDDTGETPTMAQSTHHAACCTQGRPSAPGACSAPWQQWRCIAGPLSVVPALLWTVGEAASASLAASCALWLKSPALAAAGVGGWQAA